MTQLPSELPSMMGMVIERGLLFVSFLIEGQIPCASSRSLVQPGDESD